MWRGVEAWKEQGASEAITPSPAHSRCSPAHPLLIPRVQQWMRSSKGRSVRAHCTLTAPPAAAAAAGRIQLTAVTGRCHVGPTYSGPPRPADSSTR